LRTRLSLVPLIAALALTSGCLKKSSESLHEQSQREVQDSAQDKKVSQSPRESLATDSSDIAQAMELFYGNYDVKNQTSAALLPQWRLPAEVPMTVKPLFHAFYSDAGAGSFVLVTYAVPANFVGHAAAPTIGIAFLSGTGTTWKIEASNRAATYAGEWGDPPTGGIELVQIGPNHHGVKMTDSGGGQGAVTTLMELLVPWNGMVTVGLKRVVGNNDFGMCDVEGPHLPCFENHREISFIRDDKAEYYDLKVELTGTDLVGTDGRNMEARPVNGVEIFKFQDGGYVSSSHQGDVTISEDSRIPK